MVSYFLHGDSRRRDEGQVPVFDAAHKEYEDFLSESGRGTGGVDRDRGICPLVEVAAWYGIGTRS